MNAPVLAPLTPPRRLLAADIMFLVENGLIDPNARFELMDGAIIPMSPKGRLHEIAREKLMDWLRQPWAVRFRLALEHTLTLDAETIVEPDFLLYDIGRSIADAPLTGADIRLVIEVADSSWAYDTAQKAAKYAAFGIAEYWVINAQTRAARVHRGPGAQGWAEARDVAAGETLTPLCAAEASLRLTL